MKNDNNLYLVRSSCFDRILAFSIDVIFANILRTILQFIFVTGKNKIFFLETFKNFNEMYSNFKLSNIADYHVFFFTNNNEFCDIFYKWFLIIMLSGVIYNIFNYLIFKDRTIGQKIMSLRTVDRKNNSTPKFYKLLLKSVLSSLPFILISSMFAFSMLNMFNIQNLIIKSTFTLKIIFYIINICNPFVLIFTIFVIWLFWFSIYFLTNKLIMSDIISNTLVVNNKVKFEKIILDNGKEDITLVKNNESIVNIGDKVIFLIEKFNNFLIEKITKIISFFHKKNK